jgi:S1-C subfamily serine protease
MSESDETWNAEDGRPTEETPVEPAASWPQYTWPPATNHEPNHEPDPAPSPDPTPEPATGEPPTEPVWAAWPPTPPQPAAAGDPGPYAVDPYTADPYATDPYAAHPYTTSPYAAPPNPARPNPDAWGPSPWAPPPPAWGSGPAVWPPVAPAPAPTKVRRGLAAIAALALVLASAGVGAGVAIAVHNNSNTSSFDRAGNNSLGNNPSGGNGIGGTVPGGGTGSVPSGSGTLDMSAIAAKVDPALVNIDTTLAQGRAAGTGMLISSTGEILTNNHVIADSTSIKVVIGGTGPSHDAKVVGYDVTEDVALLQITDQVSNLPTITFGEPKQAQIGDPVVAIGNAGGKGGTPSVSQGRITALDQEVTAGDSGGNQETLLGMIQINAPIQPGDSGGALVDRNAKIIGMNTAAAGGGRFNSQAGSSVGFAIPIDDAVSIVNQIRTGIETDKIHIGDRALLGVQVEDLNGQAAPVTEGALVVGVQDNTGASDAGVQTGDVLVTLEGKSVADSAALRKTLGKFHPGDSVRVGWVDSTGQKHEASVKLVAGPPL